MNGRARRAWTRRGAVLVAALSVLSAAPRATGAASLPGWAKPIAKSAPPIGEENARETARVLFREIRMVYDDDGECRMRLRLAKQVLSARGSADEQIGIGAFPFTEGSKVKMAKAWHQPPGEDVERSLADMDITISDSFLTEAKARVVAVHDLRRGSLVFFEFESIEMPQFLAFTDEVDRDAAVVLSRLVVEVPKKWSVRSRWLRGDGPAPVVDDNVYTWELRDLAAALDEPLGIDARELAPNLAVSLFPPAGTKAPPSFADWAGFGRWHEGLWHGRDATTPAMAEEARKLVPAGAPWLVRVRAAALFVRDRVRYVAKEIGIGGFRPHPAAETFEKLYGDCKDKTTLFRAMLAALDVRSVPVLVNAGEDGTVADDLPGPGMFNHVIAGVPVPAGEVLPPELAGAVVDAGSFGKLLLVDTTAETSAFGALPASIAGHRAAVVGAETTLLVTVPVPPPEVNRIERKVTVTGRDGRVALVSVTRFVGESASAQRYAWRHSEREYRAAAESATRAATADAIFEDLAVEEETQDGAFVATVRWNVPFPRDGAALPLHVFGGAGNLLAHVPLAHRRTPVRYGYPRTLRVETTLTGLTFPDPALPVARRVENDRWNIETTYAIAGKDVRATWQAQLRGREFPLEAMPDLKKFYAVIGSTTAETVAVRP